MGITTDIVIVLFGDLVYSYTETVTDDDDTTDADESAVAATTTVGSSGVTTLSTADGDTITTANGIKPMITKKDRVAVRYTVSLSYDFTWLFLHIF